MRNQIAIGILMILILTVFVSAQAGANTDPSANEVNEEKTEGAAHCLTGKCPDAKRGKADPAFNVRSQEDTLAVVRTVMGDNTGKPSSNQGQPDAAQ